MKFLDNLSRHQLKKVIINRQTFVEYQYHWGGSYYLGDRFSLSEFAEMFDISTRTAQRWLEPNKTPLHVLRHLALLTGAVLASEAFDGFYITDDAIFTPAGRRFDPGTLEAIQWKMQEVEVLRRDIQKLRTEFEKKCYQLRVAADYWRAKAGAPMASNDED